MKSKKIILIVVAFIIFIIVLLVLFLAFSYEYFSYSNNTCPLINGDHYKEERYETPKDETIYFDKRYYYEYSDDFFRENCEYELVENNVDIIKKNVEISLNKLNELDDTLNIEFDYDVITSNDYYDLTIFDEGAVLLYYYDIDNHILYVTHFFK